VAGCATGGRGRKATDLPAVPDGASTGGVQACSSTSSLDAAPPSCPVTRSTLLLSWGPTRFSSRSRALEARHALPSRRRTSRPSGTAAATGRTLADVTRAADHFYYSTRRVSAAGPPRGEERLAELCQPAQRVPSTCRARGVLRRHPAGRALLRAIAALTVDRTLLLLKSAGPRPGLDLARPRSAAGGGGPPCLLGLKVPPPLPYPCAGALVVARLVRGPRPFCRGMPITIPSILPVGRSARVGQVTILIGKTSRTCASAATCS